METNSHGDEPFSQRPLLVFWETTKACHLACFHCRADAQRNAGPDELSTKEGFALIDSLARIGSPRPILVLTGGDCLMRDDVVELAAYAEGTGVPVAIAPSVTPRLTTPLLRSLRAHGVASVSLSLDGATSSTHDAVRGIDGHFASTIEALGRLNELDFTTQVNTTVMPTNINELADVAALLHELHVDVWEVFFLITTGRGTELEGTSSTQNEEICNFLVDASRYGFGVRTVEAPFFRRVASERRRAYELRSPNSETEIGPLHHSLRTQLIKRLGPSTRAIRAPSAATRDGKGIIFVAANGDVYPSGFLPTALGNVRTKDLIDIYRENDLLKAIRAATFTGPCGACEYKNLCGGSRSRAFSFFGNPLASDPGCRRVTERLLASA